MLRAAGLDRAEYWVGNVFEEKADDNDVEPWKRDASRAEAALERLGKDLAAVQPSVIVPLGGTALWAFTGSDSISQYRGAVLPATRCVPGAKLVPTYHPALVLRQWQHLSIVVGDLVRAAKEAESGPRIVWANRSILIAPDRGDLNDFLTDIEHSDLLSVDIETGWGQITCVGIATSVEKAIVVPFVDFGKPNRSYWADPGDELYAWGWLENILESPIPKLGQNFGAYDAFWLLDKMGIRVRNLRHDARLLHHALYPELEKSLAFMGNSYGSQGAWKTMRTGKTEKRDE